MHLHASPPPASSSPTAPHHKDSVKPQTCPGQLSLQLSLAASAMAASILNPPNSAAHPKWSLPSPAPSNNAFSNAATATPTTFQVTHQTPPTPSSSTASLFYSLLLPPPPTPGPRALMNDFIFTTQTTYRRPCSSTPEVDNNMDRKWRCPLVPQRAPRLPPPPATACFGSTANTPTTSHSGPIPDHPLSAGTHHPLWTPSSTNALLAKSARPPPPSFQHFLDLPSNSATACYHIQIQLSTVDVSNEQ